MTMIVLYTLTYVFFIFADLIPIYKSKDAKLFWIYSIMMAFSYVILVLISIGIKVPSPTPAIIKVVSSIFGI